MYPGPLVVSKDVTSKKNKDVIAKAFNLSQDDGLGSVITEKRVRGIGNTIFYKVDNPDKNNLELAGKLTKYGVNLNEFIESYKPVRPGALFIRFTKLLN